MTRMSFLVYRCDGDIDVLVSSKFAMRASQRFGWNFLYECVLIRDIMAH